MIDDKYYTWEYDYLQHASKEFARKHDKIAKFLNITERYQKDPFVERLCESFAFLTGGIHERLDDDFPEITNALLEHIFPQLVRPYPSCSILRVQLVNQQLTTPIRIEKGATVQGAWREHGKRYEALFQTMQALDVLPLHMEHVRFSEDRKQLFLDFQLNSNVKFENLELDTLQCFINMSEAKHYALLYHLVDQVREISFQSSEEEVTILHEANVRLPNVLRRNQSLSELFSNKLQGSRDFIFEQYAGHRILLDYFCFPQKYFYIDITGLGRAVLPKEAERFSLVFHFNEGFDDAFHISRDDILINTTPIINLSSGEGLIQPINVDERQPEYRVKPYPESRDTVDVYAVHALTSTEGYAYVPTNSYKTIAGCDTSSNYTDVDEAPVFYTTSTRRNEHGTGATSIRFIQHNESAHRNHKDKISLETLVTNGHWPRLKLGEGAINETVSGFPGGVQVDNIIRPTEMKYGAARGEYLWSFIGHLTANLRTMAEGDTLKRLLSLYNWSPDRSDNSHVKIQQGVVNVREPVYKTMYKDVGFMRALQVDVEIDVEHFEFGEGDVYLFGLILSHYLAEHASFNTHVGLRFLDVSNLQTTKKEYTWAPTLGNIALI